MTKKTNQIITIVPIILVIATIVSYLCPSHMTSNLSYSASRDQIIEKLRTFKNENAENYGIESMALFGSVARGEQNENSDVDLLIKFKSPSLYLYAELSDALETILVRHHQIRLTSTLLADKKIVCTNRWCTCVFPADVEAYANPYQQQPPQGCRDGSNPYDVGSNGGYWSSTASASDVNNAYYVDYNTRNFSPDFDGYRKYGSGVLPITIHSNLSMEIPTQSDAYDFKVIIW